VEKRCHIAVGVQVWQEWVQRQKDKEKDRKHKRDKRDRERHRSDRRDADGDRGAAGDTDRDRRHSEGDKDTPDEVDANGERASKRPRHSGSPAFAGAAHEQEDDKEGGSRHRDHIEREHHAQAEERKSTLSRMASGGDVEEGEL
jgi:hypothetical protein